MAPLVKCWLCKHEVLSLDFIRMLGQVAHAYNSSAGQADTEGPLGVAGQPSQLKQ